MKNRSLFCRVFAGLIAVLLFTVSFSSFTHAADQTVESITLSPVSKRYKLDAGQTIQDKITIVNDGKTAYDFIVYARPYAVQNDTYDPVFTATTGNADAYQWVQFDQIRYRLEPGVTTTVPYTVRVPKNAAPGGHYGVLFAETQPVTNDTTSVARKKRVGSIIYATVNGTYQMGGKALGSTVPFLQFRAPLIASTSVKNTGNSDFVDTVKFTVSDLFGTVKYQEEKDHPVLPQTTRKIDLQWSQSAWFGLFKTKVESTVLGKTTVDNGFVLMSPRWLLIVILIVVIGGIIYGIFRRTRK